MVFLIRGCLFKKTLRYGLYLYLDSHISKFGSILKTALLSITLVHNVLVQTVNIICGLVTMSNLYIPE